MTPDMKQALPRKNFMLASLREHPNARSVLLRMAEDADRSRRIRELKEGRPDLTWGRISDKVGVTERSVAAWAQKGRISYENCGKLAEVFGVDADWLWSGRQNGTPPADYLPGLATAADIQDLKQQLTDLQAEMVRLIAASRRPNRKAAGGQG